MTSRCKSGQRRYQDTFVVARRRSGRPGRRSAGSNPPWEGATHRSAASSEACRVESIRPVRGQQGAEPGTRWRRPWKGPRPWKCSPDEPCGVEGVERWHSRRGNRRGPSPPQQTDRGGCCPPGWPGSAEPYKRCPREVGESGAGVGAAHSTDEAVVAEPWRREGAALGLRVRWG